MALPHNKNANRCKFDRNQIVPVINIFESIMFISIGNKFAEKSRLSELLLQRVFFTRTRDHIV